MGLLLKVMDVVNFMETTSLLLLIEEVECQIALCTC